MRSTPLNFAPDTFIHRVYPYPKNAMTKPAYTDKYGVAIVEHASIGRAGVCVSGTVEKRGVAGPGGFRPDASGVE